MQLNKEFVPYNIASDFKELGFDEECIARYDKDKIIEVKISRLTNSNYGGWFSTYSCSAPTFSQAFRFFREKYFKMSYIYYDVEYKFCFCIGYNDKTKGFKTYEEAELACLRKLIEIVKDELGS